MFKGELQSSTTREKKEKNKKAQRRAADAVRDWRQGRSGPPGPDGGVSYGDGPDRELLLAAIDSVDHRFVPVDSQVQVRTLWTNASTENHWRLVVGNQSDGNICGSDRSM